MLPSKTFAFTQKRVNKLPSTNKTIVYTDQKQINLKLAITACGTKTYFARFKASGVAHNIKIGDAEYVRLDDARARLPL